MRQIINKANYAEGVAITPPVCGIYDDSDNDNDKSWKVPDNEMWKLNYAYIVLSTSPGGGTRRISMRVYDQVGNLLFNTITIPGQPGGRTYGYMFLQGLYRTASRVDNLSYIALPQDFYLAPGYTLRFFERYLRSSNDDMAVSFQFERYVI